MQKKAIIDIDFIGVQEPMTAEDQKAYERFLRHLQLLHGVKKVTTAPRRRGVVLTKKSEAVSFA